jgi:DNA-binding NarL/FixJ family response regulator
MEADSKVRVVISHDEPLVRAGLECALNACHAVEVRSVTEHELFEDTNLRSIDVAVADCNVGPKLAEFGSSVGVRVIVVTSDQREVSIRRAIEAGVKGYLPLSSTLVSIVHAVRSVVAGGTAIDPLAATKMLESIQGNSLTGREHQVLRLIGLGLGNKAIANKLGITVGTVKSHVKQVLAKLEVASRTQAAMLAQRRGLLSAENSIGRTGQLASLRRNIRVAILPRTAPVLAIRARTSPAITSEMPSRAMSLTRN